jgi:hypothetical protein
MNILKKLQETELSVAFSPDSSHLLNRFEIKETVLCNKPLFMFLFLDTSACYSMYPTSVIENVLIISH